MSTRPPRSPPIDLEHPEREHEVVDRLSAEEIQQIISESPVFTGAPAQALDDLRSLAQQRLVHKDRFLFTVGGIDRGQDNTVSDAIAVGCRVHPFKQDTGLAA